MNPLTERQKAILNFIEAYWQKHSISPSFREIQDHFHFKSPNAVSKHLQALEKKGYITQKRGDTFTKSRSIVPLSPQAYQVPLVGKIVAGIPVAAEDHVEDFFDLTSLGINNNSNSYFALKIHGDSMINAHILDGDIVVIKKQSRVQNNDIAAVLWNGEATIKFVQKKDEQITLVPANNTMQPIPILPENTDSFQILGRAVTIIRNF